MTLYPFFSSVDGKELDRMRSILQCSKSLPVSFCKRHILLAHFLKRCEYNYLQGKDQMSL